VSERERDRQTDRETDRQTDRETDRQTVRETERQRHRETERQRETKTETERKIILDNPCIFFQAGFGSVSWLTFAQVTILQKAFLFVMDTPRAN